MNSNCNQLRCRVAMWRLVLTGSFLAFATQLIAQEALEESFAVDRSRRARKEAIDRNLYNLKAGPLLLRFDALMGFEFNDNPQLEDDPDEVDFAFRPELDMAAVWALNARNALSFNLGLGYMKYVNNTDLDHLIIAPNSEIAIDIYTGDFVINVHERVSHSQDPVSDPTVSGTGDFGGIENTVGVRADWNLNQLTISAGYDHFNFISTGSGISKTLRVGTNAPPPNTDDAQDRSSELFYGRAGVRLSPAVTAGLEASGGLTDYESDFFHDNSQFSIGPFVEAQITRDVKGRVAGGYIHSQFEDNSMGPAPDSVDDFYAEVSVEHQLNQYLSHKLSLGREARAGAATELVTLYYARYDNHWMMNRFSTLHTSLFYENGRERSGVTEKFERVGAGVGVTVPLSRKLNAGIAYQLLHRNSDQANRDYLQNSITTEL
ncbi:MAG TPA: outer membrane beta-barrel protein, partial [Verrucomicrobiae bacterium]